VLNPHHASPTCRLKGTYRNQEFVRVGYYLKVDYKDDEYQAFVQEWEEKIKSLRVVGEEDVEMADEEDEEDEELDEYEEDGEDDEEEGEPEEEGEGDADMSEGTKCQWNCSVVSLAGLTQNGPRRR